MFSSLDLNKSWIEYHHQKSDENFWACKKLIELIHENPALVWESILTIVELDSSPNIIDNLAAGPLEDLLVYHGSSYIDKMEILARQNPVFTRLIKGVWKNAIPQDIWVRVNAIQTKYANTV